MKKFKIKALYSNGERILEISGKDLGDAFYKFYKAEAKQFRTVIGFEYIPNV